MPLTSVSRTHGIRGTACPHASPCKQPFRICEGAGTQVCPADALALLHESEEYADEILRYQTDLSDSISLLVDEAYDMERNGRNGTANMCGQGLPEVVPDNSSAPPLCHPGLRTSTPTHLARWYGAGAPCSGVKNIDLGRDTPVFISDGSPVYSRSMRCTWLITSPGPIEVVFLDFSTERGYDFVELRAEGLSEKLDGPFTPGPFRTNDAARNMTITFTTDSFRNSDGFIAKIRVIQPGETAARTAATEELPPILPTAGATSASCVFFSTVQLETKPAYN